MLTKFVSSYMGMVVAVLAKVMIPYKDIPSRYYENEKTLFELYNPEKKMFPSAEDPTFGENTYYGSCYQALTNLRNWFNSNMDMIESFCVHQMYAKLGKVEI